MLLYGTPSIIQSLTVLLREIKEVPRVLYSSLPILVHIILSIPILFLVHIILLKYQIIIILIDIRNTAV